MHTCMHCVLTYWGVGRLGWRVGLLGRAGIGSQAFESDQYATRAGWAGPEPAQKSHGRMRMTGADTRVGRECRGAEPPEPVQGFGKRQRAPAHCFAVGDLRKASNHGCFVSRFTRSSCFRWWIGTEAAASPLDWRERGEPWQYPPRLGPTS